MDAGEFVVAQQRPSELGSDADESDEVAKLNAKVKLLEDDNHHLRETLMRLQEQVASATPAPVDEHYTLDQFMVALAKQRGRTYGWRTDYAQATEETPGSFKVSTDDIQKWQKERRVPQQAYVQIDWLKYPERVGKSPPKLGWKPHEDDYLIGLCKANPAEPNANLSRSCTEHFGRPIDEPAIKGKKHRLIHAGRLPECDPKEH